MGLVMDQEIRLEFQNLNKKLDDFIISQTRLCGDRKTEIGILKQRLDNGEKQEENEIKQKAVKFSYDRLIVSIIVGGFGIFEVLKHLGVIH